MTSTLQHRTIRSVLLAMLAAAFVLGSAGSGAQAQEDDDAAPDVRFFRNVLKSFGLRRDGAAIDYRERSPLVVPPSRNLPPPQGDAAARNPAWPNDPDVRRAREAKAAPRVLNIDSAVDDESRALSPDKLRGVKPTRPGSAPGQPEVKNPHDVDRPMSRTELGAKNLFDSIWKKEEYTVFGGEPARSDLTQPPAGYRTPSPTQPYGVGTKKWKYEVGDRHEPVR
jgi:hypothetical protein